MLLWGVQESCSPCAGEETLPSLGRAKHCGVWHQRAMAWFALCYSSDFLLQFEESNPLPW